MKKYNKDQNFLTGQHAGEYFTREDSSKKKKSMAAKMNENIKLNTSKYGYRDKIHAARSEARLHEKKMKRLRSHMDKDLKDKIQKTKGMDFRPKFGMDGHEIHYGK